MALIRVYKIAEELKTTSQEVITLLRLRYGIEVRSAASTIDMAIAHRLIEEIADEPGLRPDDAAVPASPSPVSLDGSIRTAPPSSRLGSPATSAVTPAHATLSAPVYAVSASQLSEWRRQLVTLLRRLDQPADSASPAGAAAMIGRLTRTSQVPRNVGALMKVITEMRNVTEYESKTLSRAESEAVHSAWLAVCEWAHSAGHRLNKE